MFAKTGIPPRIARQIFTHKEAQVLRIWMRTNPIDDQSNFHVPIAQLQSTVVAMMGGKQKLTDFLIFRENDGDIDSLLAGNDWGDA